MVQAQGEAEATALGSLLSMAQVAGVSKDITSPNTDTHIRLGTSDLRIWGYMDPIWGLFGSPPEGSTACSPITYNGGSLDSQCPLNHGLKPPILGVILGHFGV